MRAGPLRDRPSSMQFAKSGCNTVFSTKRRPDRRLSGSGHKLSQGRKTTICLQNVTERSRVSRMQGCRSKIVGRRICGRLGYRRNGAYTHIRRRGRHQWCCRPRRRRQIPRIIVRGRRCPSKGEAGNTGHPRQIVRTSSESRFKRLHLAQHRRRTEVIRGAP